MRQLTYDNNYQILTDFQNSFIKILRQMCCKVIAKILPHLKRIATLPCEILMSENKRQFETGTVLKALQLGIWGIVAFSTKIYCKFTAKFACRRILRSVNIWLIYRQES